MHGTGSVVSQPAPLNEGLLIATATIGAAGDSKLVNAAGDSVLLANSAKSVTNAQHAATVYKAGKYYRAVEFYADPGDWSVKWEQPTQ